MMSFVVEFTGKFPKFVIKSVNIFLFSLILISWCPDNWEDWEIIKWEKDVKNIRSYKIGDQTFYNMDEYYGGSLTDDCRVLIGEEIGRIILKTKHTIIMAKYIKEMESKNIYVQQNNNDGIFTFKNN